MSEHNDISPEERADEAFVAWEERTINEARFIEESQPFIDSIPVDERTIERVLTNKTWRHLP
jgi:hypothetical protein